MKPVMKEDLFKYKFLSDIKSSPSGKNAVYVQHNMVKKGYHSRIMAFNTMTEKSEPLTKDSFASSPVWLDDDSFIYMTKVNEGSKFMKFDMISKTASDAFSIKYPVSDVLPLPSGKFIFKAEVDLKKEGKDKATVAAEDDYIVVEEIPYWENGAGFISRIRNTLFIYDPATDTLKAITEPLFQTTAVTLLNNKIYFTGASYDVMPDETTGLYCCDVDTLEVQAIIPSGSFAIGDPFAVNDNLYFTLSKMDKYGSMQYGDIYCLDQDAPEGYRFLACIEKGIHSYLVGDCHRGMSASKGAWQGKLMYLSIDGYSAGLHTIDTTGTITNYPVFDGSIDGFATLNNKILLIGAGHNALQELYSYDAVTGTYKQLTNINTSALKNCYVGELEYCGFTDSDGVDIDGWVIKPIDFDPEKKYPGVLSMHGGPRGAFGEVFVHEMQMLAGAGYFVFFCNPRGSDGKGEEFADLRGKWGTIDYTDFMEFTDHVLSVYPQLKADKLSAIGGSYGGYMANWLVGHTDRFAAIVSQRSFCNVLSDFGNSCIGYNFDKDQFDGTPWSNPTKLWDHSPLKYACNAVTPTLFIHSIEDYNCPLSEGLQMFTALKYHGCEAKMCLFKGENHNLSRSGKPLHRLHRLQEIQGWLDTHLK